MSKAYEDFARDTFERTQEHIAQAIEASGNLPVLVFSGEEHKDSSIERLTNTILPSAFEEPSLAASYTHIAAIKSAIELAGRENVIVSFETDQLKLDIRRNALQRGIEEGVEQEDVLAQFGSHGYAQYPAMYFALKQGLELVASDPQMRTEEARAPERYNAEIEALGKHALRTVNQPRIVVHIGGAGHIGSLQGHKIEDLVENGESLTRNGAPNPFEGIYGKAIFFNTHKDHAFSVTPFFGADSVYAQNPDNAIQIDPPGQMDESDKKSNNIIDRIENAAEELHQKCDGLERLDLNERPSRPASFSEPARR